MTTPQYVTLDDIAFEGDVSSAHLNQIKANLEHLISPPSVCGVQTSPYTVATDTFTELPFTAADEWDTDAFHDPGGDDTKFTVPTGLGGRYLCIASVTWDTFASAAVGSMYLRINGTGDNIPLLAETPITDAGITQTSMNGSDILELSAGDYVEVLVAHRGAGDEDVDRARFTMTKVGRS